MKVEGKNYEDLYKESQNKLRQATIKLLELSKTNPSPIRENRFIETMDSIFFYLRRYGRDKSEFMFLFVRYSMFILILLSLTYAIYMFGSEISDFFRPTSKEYSIELVNRFKTTVGDSINRSIQINLTDSQRKELIDIIGSSSEDVLNYKSANKDMITLKIIEHIFIYLLPFFVLLGLYYYFESNFKYKLLKTGYFDEKEIENAEKNLTTTKTLFISVFMSYTIIKIIEKLFFEDSEKGFEINKIIAYGVFLVLLMGYLLLSHRTQKH